MQPAHARHGDFAPASVAGRLPLAAATALFCATFLYIWVSFRPFPDLTFMDQAAAPGVASNLANQIAALAMLSLLVGYVLACGRHSLILRPRVLLFLIFAWLLAVSLPSPDPLFAVRRLAMAAIVCTAASVMLILPRNERHFAAMLAACTGLVLALCYAGVILFSRYAVHQFTDELEPLLEGDWRGLYSHKNTAGTVMVVAVLFGLYVTRVLGPLVGLPIVLLAGIFLVFTGSKTSAAMLPATLALSFLVVRLRYARALLVVGSLACVWTLTIGSALSERIAAFVKSLGVDPTFTLRSEVWSLALEHIPKKPWFGYGYQSFWRNTDLMHGFREEFSWAVNAVNAHNSYLDLLLTAGIPGTLLMMVFLVALPLRYIGQAERNGGSRRLTELFTRIWIFGLLAGCLESILFDTIGVVWFSMLMAIFGLRLQARAHLRQ
jgi:O-antigen ligase